jgi:hypothetical protein
MKKRYFKLNYLTIKISAKLVRQLSNVNYLSAAVIERIKQRQTVEISQVAV